MPRPLNEELMVGHDCFGCGLGNPHGLQIHVFRDGDRTDRLVGKFEPRAEQIGFPNIVHGGIQFTALDCMAGWAMLMLRGKPYEMPLTASSTMSFYKPVTLGRLYDLSMEITKEPETPRDAFGLVGQFKDASGQLLSEATFDYVLLPAERFEQAVGIDALPESYEHFFAQR